MITAMVLGANGQDGSFLCERLAVAGRRVIGVGRQPNFRYQRPTGEFCYTAADIGDSHAIDGILDEHAPDEVYHVAAIHGHAGCILDERFGEACDVNVKSLHRVLEHSRRRSGRCRVFYASSAKVLGSLSGRVTLNQSRRGRCLYGMTKNMAGDLAAHYRRSHGVETTIAIMFHHESIRRPAGFFIPTVCGILAAAMKDDCYRGQVATLSFCCDWSSARDFMDLAVMSIDRGMAGEVLFASGRTYDARPFVRSLFDRHGLDVDAHLVTSTDHPYERYEVDISETIERLGHQPRETIYDVCDEIILSKTESRAA